MTFRHRALLYRGPDDFVCAISSVVNRALAAGEAVAVAVPPNNLQQVRTVLGSSEAGADRVTYVDMADAGRNPGRIIPLIIGPFLAGNTGSPVTFVGEPIWAGRSPAEYAAAVSHEALINLAFADRDDVTIVCPYDAARLSRRVLSDAERTHPAVVEYGSERAGFRYTDAERVADDYNRPLHEPHGLTDSLTFSLGDGLLGVRQHVRAFAERAKLAAERVSDLCTAVNEVATNTLVHTGNEGHLRCWRSGDGLVCEIRDSGKIGDPLFDRRPPEAGESGRGLLLVHQLCDLVQTYVHAFGLVIRLHMRFT
ncbi:anti-sigma factor RsbA family regulatory protein [Flindersiella endophytica]